MKFDLSQMVRRPSKRPIVLANIKPTQVQADDLATLYLRVVARWTAAIERIIAAYSAALSKLQTDSANDAGSTIDSVDAEVKRLILLLTPELRDWALKVERVHRGKWAANILSAASVDLNTVLLSGDVTETVDSVINWNVALIKDVSQEAQKRIATAVFSGLQQRKPATEIAKEIREAVSMARSRSIRIAGDQIRKMGESLNDARRHQAGINHWKWRSSHKLHYRPAHQARDGIIYSDANPPGSYPPAPQDRPGQLPYCGCTSQSVVVFED
jgi:uncharacterized protein with gpF-like domain